MKEFKVALIGNQNSGKTTLFNVLTGSQQRIGNFPGTTVEKKEGTLEEKNNIHIIDLPGVYSLSTYSMDEIVAISYLLEEKPDAIINIVDATNIERNLYLTMQLLELNIPMIVVLNMMDLVKKQHQTIDIEEISNTLGVLVIAISAQKKQGVDQLIKQVESLLEHTLNRPHIQYLEGSKYIDEVLHVISSSVPTKKYSVYWAIMVLEQDEMWLQKLNLTPQQQLKITAIRKLIEKKNQTDIESFIIQMRYHKIAALCNKAIYKGEEYKNSNFSNKIDTVLTHKYLGLPIFLTIMWGMFVVTFHTLGTPLQMVLSTVLHQCNLYIVAFLTHFEVAPWFLSLLQNGIFAGIGSVLSFLPIVILLFFFLSVLEDSGYMARIAFLMDALLQKIGISGKSFVPMIIGFGCSVPAILATRSLPSERDRKLTILLIPFISCSAKLPVYSIIVNAFFPEKAAIVMLLMYSIGVFIAICIALFLKSTVFLGESVPFLMELPTYRIPTIRNLWQQMYAKAKGFITRVFTIIFLASIVIWFLQSFNFQLQYMSHPEHSILANIGYAIAWLFKPIGFGDWRLATSLLTGVIAKESVVSTLTILTGSMYDTQLIEMLPTLLTPSSALSFLTFTILYAPCVATIAIIYKELQSFKETALLVVSQTILAYMVAYAVYLIATIVSVR